jgi:hypothetical protein
MARLCENIIVQNKAAVQELLVNKTPKEELERKLCYEVSSACSRPTPAFTGSREDEEFKVADKDDLELLKTLAQMEEQGMSGTVRSSDCNYTTLICLCIPVAVPLLPLLPMFCMHCSYWSSDSCQSDYRFCACLQSDVVLSPHCYRLRIFDMITGLTQHCRSQVCTANYPLFCLAQLQNHDLQRCMAPTARHRCHYLCCELLHFLASNLLDTCVAAHVECFTCDAAVYRPLLPTNAHFSECSCIFTCDSPPMHQTARIQQLSHVQMMSREEALKKLEDYSHLLGEDGLSPDDITRLRSVNPGSIKDEL